MTTRIAINGFGRIGRAVLRSAIERDAEMEVVAVNDVTDVDTLAQLLSLDSVYGRLASPVAALDGAIEVAGRRIKVFTDDGSGALPPGAAGGRPRRHRRRRRVGGAPARRRGASWAPTSSSRRPAVYARARMSPATSRPARAR